MPGVARQGDLYGPGGVLTSPSSPDVFVNGRPVALDLVQYTAHPCCGAQGCPPSHCGGPTFDFGSVIINNKPPVRLNASGLCGHRVMTASENVIIG